MTDLGSPIQGVTLYSFTRAFHGREYDLEGLIRKVAADGLGPGLEIIGFSSFRGFPHVDDAFVDWFQGLVAETGLVLTSCAVNTDVGIRRDRLLTDDELIAYMEQQIAAAARLGFPLARVQISLTPDSMEKLLPVAERYGITLAIEVHAHHHSRHELVQALVERYEKLGSPLLGFVADWGTTTTGLAPSMVEAYRRRGASSEFLDAADQLWRDYYEAGPPLDDPSHGARFGSFIELAATKGSPELGIDLAINATGLFGPARVESWIDLMPWVRHVHGKFFGIDAKGEEPSVPVRDLIALLVNAGYNGAISSEYEGWHWNYWDDAFGIIAGEQALQRSAAEAAGSAMIVDAKAACNQLQAHFGRSVHAS
jgi:sugar phosphate isomerase/epimerase